MSYVTQYQRWKKHPKDKKYPFRNVNDKKGISPVSMLYIGLFLAVLVLWGRAFVAQTIRHEGVGVTAVATTPAAVVSATMTASLTAVTTPVVTPVVTVGGYTQVLVPVSDVGYYCVYEVTKSGFEVRCERR